ncbi:hypothetical protein [Ramlibacter rhizophilus]|uniref:Pilus assembly protein PilY n=1 Tax=Ramlibacter rhizophilus TaxID=1781167 RepID=A0A4Z0C353_9BURK|nr:hypothetical protein [Ramlibacter rhizophilus]TFZ04655.1 hypothetical protein EZ242_02585 [Ramlibacter rhizophilus]
MRSLLAIVAAALATTAWGLTIPPVPLSVQQSAPPLVMLVSGKDHRLFYEAYNDASDIDGDGTLDIRFKPGITYLGLFNPNYCYTYGVPSLPQGFTPTRTTPDGRCVGQWSGNWLNYVTTSRIDALRVVLYGGMRDVDTETQTVLRRAYIPQDAHSWAKEYTSEAVDAYRISDYTPVPQPNAGKRHFFGNVTRTNGVDCSVLANCSNLPPWLSVVENSTSRVWKWASSEAPVLADVQRLEENPTPRRTNYTVRVSVCTPGFTQGCKQYPSGTNKPTGLLHEYGESGAMQFGLLTGSYDNSMAGGRLRKVISSFTDEVNARTGQFTGATGIVRSYDALRIRDHNNGMTNPRYRGPFLTDRGPLPGEFPDWGNPVGEMMYEALRYFAGKRQPTSTYAGGGRAMDDAVGLPAPAWDDPFDKINSAAKAPLCGKRRPELSPPRPARTWPV